MNRDSHAGQYLLRRVLDRAFEGIGFNIVGQYHSSAVYDLVISCVQSEINAGFSSLIAFMGVTVPGLIAFVGVTVPLFSWVFVVLIVLSL
jgi:hypothetical protein